MKVTYNWLKEYVEFDYTPEQLVEKLTMIGHEVDDLLKQEAEFEGVVVGHVLKKEAHPNADKLSLCEVDVGNEKLSIICGAPNVAVGQKVPVAVNGAKLPGGFKIKRTKIRGIESNGMICSESELKLSNRADGIMVLENTLEPGTDFKKLVSKVDFLIDIDVTPNRPDCFGVIGIARDIATSANTEMTKPEAVPNESDRDVGDFVKVNILDKEKCPRYSARYIENIKIKPSPLWLVQQLESVGIRSINNVVDVTNYVMMETGQPLHAFDYKFVEGGEINVRCAKDGEKFTTLDEKKHKLNPEALLICDKEKAVALGGIMGGLNSEVSADTKSVLLESAYFNPKNIRRTSKHLSISTESSKRFERGVDPNGALYALNRAAGLIVKLGEGDVAKGCIDAYPAEIGPIKIKLRTERVELLLGIKIPASEIKSILERLDFVVVGENEFTVEVPTFRPDVTLEADLIEEVARIYGFDNIPADTSCFVEQDEPKDDEEYFVQKLKQMMISFGFSEAVTFDLVSPDMATSFLTEGEPVKLINPLSEEMAVLRSSLIPSLLNSVRWNINRGEKNLKLFEVGTKIKRLNGKNIEAATITGVMTGKLVEDTWKNKYQAGDFYDLKGIVQRLVHGCRIQKVNFGTFRSEFVTGKALSVKVGELKLGHFGELNFNILKSFAIDQSVFYFEILLDDLRNAAQADIAFTSIPKFPSVIRDLAVVLRNEVASENLVEAVTSEGGKLLKDVQVFDVFKGKQLGEGLKSIALNLTFSSMERTLTEVEIDKRIDRILKSLKAEFSAELRS